MSCWTWDDKYRRIQIKPEEDAMHIQILATNITQEEMDEVRAMNADRFYCHLYGTLIHILLSSMIAFQCRYFLYEKYQMEGSEPCA